MILYATKQTIERLRLPLYDGRQTSKNPFSNEIYTVQNGDPLVEWGMKLFYFNRKKCIQVMNFSSKFALLIYDLRVEDAHSIPIIVAQYLIELYRDDLRMLTALRQYFIDYAPHIFMGLTNRSIISSLNRNQSDFAWDGQIFYDYIQDGVLQTIEINHRLNFGWFTSQKINGKTDYVLPGERFRTLILERYDNQQPHGYA